MYPYLFMLTIFPGWIFGLLKNPFYCVAVYVFVYFNIPARQWWEYKVPDLRYSLLASLCLLTSYYIHRNKLDFRSVLRDNSFRMLMLLFLLMVLITPIAYNPSASWDRAVQFFKYLVPYYCFLKIISRVEQYKVVMAVFVLNFFYLAYMGRHYFNGVRLDGIGVVDAMDANLLAAFILLIVPFLIVNILWGKKWERYLSLISFPFIVNLFMLTRSRGGFVGLAISLFSLFAIIKPVQTKIKIVIPLIAVCIISYSLSDQAFRARINGLFDDSIEVSDKSSGRYLTWLYGLKMLLDYPLGTGGNGFELLSPQYLPENLLESTVGVRASHNTYIQVLVEQGYIGLLLYLLFIYIIISNLHSTRKILSTHHTEDENNQYIINQTYALEAGLFGFWGASIFINRLYFEGIYLFCALSPILYNIAVDRISLKAPQPPKASPNL